MIKEDVILSSDVDVGADGVGAWSATGSAPYRVSSLPLNKFYSYERVRYSRIKSQIWSRSSDKITWTSWLGLFRRSVEQMYFDWFYLICSKLVGSSEGFAFVNLVDNFGDGFGVNLPNFLFCCSIFSFLAFSWAFWSFFAAFSRSCWTRIAFSSSEFQLSDVKVCKSK